MGRFYRRCELERSKTLEVMDKAERSAERCQRGKAHTWKEQPKTNKMGSVPAKRARRIARSFLQKHRRQEFVCCSCNDGPVHAAWIEEFCTVYSSLRAFPRVVAAACSSVPALPCRHDAPGLEDFERGDISVSFVSSAVINMTIRVRQQAPHNMVATINRHQGGHRGMLFANEKWIGFRPSRETWS